jgi:enamine deaminase RidA (YjgF/YER057c/UK114 family)
MKRKNISSGSPYEENIGFSRATRVGNIIAVSGTAPVGPDSSAAHVGDLYNQTRQCLRIIEKSIKEAGGRRDDIIRTRIMLTDITRWEEAARAHGEFFSGIRPASTFVEVKGFIDSEWLVEIEADCVIE